MSLPNFGAPVPPRPAFSYQLPAKRRPGVGDHVCVQDLYVGLIVDLMPGGFVAVAKRSRCGRSTVEMSMLVDILSISPITPICANEDIDPTWRRGALG